MDDMRDVIDLLLDIRIILQEANDMQREWIAECRSRDEQALANQEVSMQRQQESRNRNEDELRRHNEAIRRIYEKEMRTRTDGLPDTNTGQPG